MTRKRKSIDLRESQPENGVLHHTENRFPVRRTKDFHRHETKVNNRELWVMTKNQPTQRDQRKNRQTTNNSVCSSGSSKLFCVHIRFSGVGSPIVKRRSRIAGVVWVAKSQRQISTEKAKVHGQVVTHLHLVSVSDLMTCEATIPIQP